ncbi:MAG: helix-turn-helix transcriptional regulator [Alphaproteobacteria bacterium]|nr:helix-turn-helix transcriptional regulator [Alphaproteobacteria bacterium]
MTRDQESPILLDVTLSHGLRGRIQRLSRLGVSQAQIARAAGFHPSLLSRYLNGRRSPPPQFRDRVVGAIGALEAAESAAAAVRKEVLAERLGALS